MNFENIYESYNYLKENVEIKPEIGIILGSGLGDVVNLLSDKQIISYKDIPFFPCSNVVGHEGNLVFGKVNNLNVVIMQGRTHYYEGKGFDPVVYPIYVLKLLGIDKLIITNACGAVNENFKPGDLMLITDYINLLGINPLIGDNNEDFGPRFPDMSESYSKELINKVKNIADIPLQEGVYAFFNGPCYETAAEIRAYKMMGADVVGMSTVPETIVANYMGIKVLGISCITNMATGLAKEKHSHKEVLEVANRSSLNLCNLIKNFLLSF